MSALHELSALEQVNGIRSRELSPVELTEHYLTRIDRYAELGAFVTVTPELARREARQAERRVMTEPVEQLPPLLGLPLGFKDVHPVAGVRTAFGCKALEDHVPTEDAWTVGLLRAAGAVTLGMTHAPEFGAACYTETSLLGRPAVTPYDTGRYASGSSGGSAAAVAAGLQPVGHASDGGGSTRGPAAACGLVGIKPTRGVVSAAPSASFVSLGIEGVLARSVFDAALLMDVMARPAPGDLYARSFPHGAFCRAATEPPPEGLRIAKYVDPGFGITVDPEVLGATDHAACALKDLGHEVIDVEVPVPWDEELLQSLVLLFSGDVGSTVRQEIPLERHELLRPFTRHLAALSERCPVDHYVAAQSLLARSAARHTAALSGFDLVLTPTTPMPAVRLGWFDQDGVEGVGRRMLSWMAFSPWANLSGSSAIALPLRLSTEGLPVGVQLAGVELATDLLLVTVAAAMEEAGAWQPTHPPQWWDGSG